MTLFARYLPGARAVLLTLATLGLLSGPTLADDNTGPCDCSCSGYQALLDRIDISPASAAGQIDQCGAGCAIAWARCEQAMPVGPNDTQASLNTLLERFLSGASTGDVAMHERFWSDDLVYTSSAGQRYGKPELMAGLASSPAETEPTTVYSADQVRIRVYDQLALIDFTLVATATDASQQRFLNSGVLKQEGHQWRAVNWQATRKADP